ncbi:amidase [Flexibacterium corallicola]|uniref:amidase n=1 Tax=Flexibacterium corallicola TaxID=3037259 RepID=UPI00286F3122|nr:amidase [Pseudovibrio sp. M1P-2-3]
MLYENSATKNLGKLKSGEITSVQLVKSYLERINETDRSIQAWASLDPDFALDQAEKWDEIYAKGLPLGTLHGLPIGIKDIIDTKDFPTEWGTPVFKGRQPKHDAFLVARLKEAGAVLLGKTTCTEFALFSPSKTHNPHNPDYTPGGSSSGSAAATAAKQIPLALGTQTDSSLICPASYCGTYAFKPTIGVLSRRGLEPISQHFDQPGIFANSIEDLILLGDCLSAYDPRDPLSYPRPRPQLSTALTSPLSKPPRFVWFDLPYADQLDEQSRQLFEDLLSRLNGKVTRIKAPSSFDDYVSALVSTYSYEISRYQNHIYSKNWNQLSEEMQSFVKTCEGLTQTHYDNALKLKNQCDAYFSTFFESFDAVLTPSSTGIAPKFEEGIGNPVFCSLWTFAGLPALNLPIFISENGMPVGLQMIGARERDSELLASAAWLEDELRAS